jgi:hypothetical protein
MEGLPKEQQDPQLLALIRQRQQGLHMGSPFGMDFLEQIFGGMMDEEEDYWDDADDWDDGFEAEGFVLPPPRRKPRKKKRPKRK